MRKERNKTERTGAGEMKGSERVRISEKRAAKTKIQRVCCVFAGILLAFGLTGCQKQDTERLGRTKTDLEDGEAEDGGTERPTGVGSEAVTEEELIQWREEVFSLGPISEYVSVSLPETVSLQVLSSTVTEEELESYLQDFLTSFATCEQLKDRVTEEGDVAAVSYDIFQEGELVESHGSDMAPVMVQLWKEGGDGDVLSHLIGQKCGEEIRFSIPGPQAAGKTDGTGENYTVTAVIYWIQGEESVPVLDQTFVDSLSGYEASSVEELEESLRQELAAYKKSRSDYYKQLDLWYEIMKNTRVKEYPENMLERHRQETEQEYRRYADWYGYDSLEEYGREVMGVTAEELDRYLEDAAKKRCEEELAILSLSQEKPEFMPDTAQIREGMEIYAGTYGYGDGYADEYGDGYEDGYGDEYGREKLWKQVILALVKENILTYVESIAEITFVDSFDVELNG